MISKNNCRGRALRIAVGIMALVLLMPGGAGAATITVDDSGGAGYTIENQLITTTFTSSNNRVGVP